MVNGVSRVSTANGHPPSFLQHNDIQCRNVVKDTLAPELMTLFELQKFSNRLHTAMTAQILSNNAVPETVVKTWEDEFEVLRPLVTHVETGKTKDLAISNPRMTDKLSELRLFSFHNPHCPAGSPGLLLRLTSRSTPELHPQRPPCIQHISEPH